MRCITLCLLLAGSTVVQAQNGPGGRTGPSDPWNYGNPGDRNWNNSWNNRPNPRRGACFFTDPGFRGNHFCVRGGDRLPQLPGNFGDNISSIQTFGGTSVMIYNDRNFKGGGAPVRSSVADLRSYKFRGGHTWNDRVSSMIVR